MNHKIKKYAYQILLIMSLPCVVVIGFANKIGFDETFEYPSGYTNIPNMYDKINQSVIQDLEISATYGIDMGRIKEDIKNTPIASFYKQ